MLILFCFFRNGGAIFHGMCNEVGLIHSRCFWVGLSTSPEATSVYIQNNEARGNVHTMLLAVLNYTA